MSRKECKRILSVAAAIAHCFIRFTFYYPWPMPTFLCSMCVVFFVFAIFVLMELWELLSCIGWMLWTIWLDCESMLAKKIKNHMLHGGH